MRQKLTFCGEAKVGLANATPALLGYIQRRPRCLSYVIRALNRAAIPPIRSSGRLHSPDYPRFSVPALRQSTVHCCRTNSHIRCALRMQAAFRATTARVILLPGQASCNQETS